MTKSVTHNGRRLHAPAVCADRCIAAGTVEREALADAGGDHILAQCPAEEALP